MRCDSCKRSQEMHDEESYECDSCGYAICYACMKKQGKRCRKCTDGRLSSH